MPRDRKKAVNLLPLAADLVLAQLWQEAEAERHEVDDDVPSPPDPLASAQSRRAAVAGGVK